jgi:hypothetical protein
MNSDNQVILWLVCPQDLSAWRYRILSHEAHFMYASTTSREHEGKYDSKGKQELISACEAAVFGPGWRDHEWSKTEYHMALRAKLSVWAYEDGKTFGDLMKWLTEVAARYANASGHEQVARGA